MPSASALASALLPPDGVSSPSMEVNDSSSINNSTSQTSTSDDDIILKIKDVNAIYIMPTLACFGILFNLASILFLYKNEVRLIKSLVLLFIFLNVFDSLFLLTTFFVFAMPVINHSFRSQYLPVLAPYLMPVLQTCLTVSVYATVAIAVNGCLIVRPIDRDGCGSASSSQGNAGSRFNACCSRLFCAPLGACRAWAKMRGFSVAGASACGIFMFAVLFNLPRWFEYSTVYLNDTNEYDLLATPLRTNPNYVQYYSLLGSGFVMVIVPFLAFFIAFASIHRAMMDGIQRKRTFRLMTIITTMFLICHLPKVVLTVYEVTYHRYEIPNFSRWSMWPKLLTEFSHVLLVCYSALNPIAYCGDLVYRHTLSHLTSMCCKKELSDIEIMESYGITIRGIDSIEQQLKDLDPQSRILSGLNPNPRGLPRLSSADDSKARESDELLHREAKV